MWYKTLKILFSQSYIILLTMFIITKFDLNFAITIMIYLYNW